MEREGDYCLCKMLSSNPVTVFFERVKKGAYARESRKREREGETEAKESGAEQQQRFFSLFGERNKRGETKKKKRKEKKLSRMNEQGAPKIRKVMQGMRCARVSGREPSRQWPGSTISGPSTVALSLSLPLAHRLHCDGPVAQLVRAWY